jgi:hypothetical protein
MSAPCQRPEKWKGIQTVSGATPLGDQRLHIQARARGRAQPHALAVANASVGSRLGVDFHKRLLLQLGQPGVGAGFLAAAFVLDQRPEVMMSGNFS